MIIDMNYWSKVFRRVIIFVLTILGIYLTFKLAMFYIPFLIAFIISLLIEPLIKFVKKKTKLTRKTSAIIVMLIVFSLIIGLLVWGITSLITEASDLLQGLNGYFDTAYEKIQEITNNFDFEANYHLGCINWDLQFDFENGEFGFGPPTMGLGMTFDLDIDRKKE